VDFIKSFWPRSLFASLGLMLSAMSVLKLLEHGFAYGFGPTFTLALSYYENLVHALIGSWAEPIVKSWLAELKTYVGDLKLYPHWKHIFVLMNFYFVRDAQTANLGWPTVIFTLIWGFVVATVSSIAAGTVLTTAVDVTANFAVAAIPITGMFVYDLIYMMWAATLLREQQAQEYHEATPTWCADMAAGLPWLVGRTVAAFALLWFGLQLPLVQQSQSPGLLMLALLVFALGLYWLGEAALGTNQLRNKEESWLSAYRRNGIASLGAAILAVFFWAALFIAANAGLRFYGL